MCRRRPLLLLLLGVVSGCREEDPVDIVPRDVVPPPAGNVLLLITDDIGIDKTAVYGEHPTPAPTPNIDALAAQGVLFRNAYAHPTCSPSRASLLTGRHPTRHGLGRWLHGESESHALPADEVTIPQMLALADESWSSTALGKWHLVGFETEEPSLHPLRAGFNTHAGSLANPDEAVQEGHSPRGYENWEKNVNGELGWSTDYVTTDTFDDAVALLPELPEPWFLYVASNSAHTPMHNPPADLLSTPLDESATELDQYNAMVQVLDDEIGRFLDSIPADLRERTTIIYTSDNGTPRDVDVIQEPWDPTRGKQTVYEGGVNVPLIITGPLVTSPGSECAALVSLVDLMPTMAEIAHVDLAGVGPVLDGFSLLPQLRDAATPSQHETMFSEQFYPNGDANDLDWRDRMVRNEDWKLIRKERWDGDGVLLTTHEFFRMEAGAWDEGQDLLSVGPLDASAQSAYDDLEFELDGIADSLVYGHAAAP